MTMHMHGFAPIETLYMGADLIMRAAEFARAAHAGQVRKFSGLPYSIHPARVAGRVALHPLADEEMVAAAFLHDVVEDTACTLEEIENEFGDRVARMVGELTKPTEHPGDSRSERKRQQLQQISGAGRQAKIIKLLDRIDNLGDLPAAPLEFARLYGSESRRLADAIGEADLELKQELLDCIDQVPENT